MFRKLALVGLVLIVGRGTVAQLSIAIVLAFGFFAVHVKCWPYKVCISSELRVVFCVSCHFRGSTLTLR